MEVDIKENNRAGAGKVAIIDDDPEILKAVRLILSTAGYEVIEASGGALGSAMVKRELPDVVLLDIMMPDVDGFDVLRKLKIDERTRKIPVIFLSGKTGIEHINKGLSLGAQGYITKPFKPSDLVEKVKELIGMSRGKH